MLRVLQVGQLHHALAVIADTAGQLEDHNHNGDDYMHNDQADDKGITEPPQVCLLCSRACSQCINACPLSVKPIKPSVSLHKRAYKVVLSCMLVVQLWLCFWQSCLSSLQQSIFCHVLLLACNTVYMTLPDVLLMCCCIRCRAKALTRSNSKLSVPGLLLLLAAPRGSCCRI